MSSVQVARVSRKGRTTIPKEFREKLGIDTPGRVRFRETKNGMIVIEPVPHPDDKLGSRADRVGEGETAETLGWLREKETELERMSVERHRDFE